MPLIDLLKNDYLSKKALRYCGAFLALYFIARIIARSGWKGFPSYYYTQMHWESISLILLSIILLVLAKGFDKIFALAVLVFTTSNLIEDIYLSQIIYNGYSTWLIPFKLGANEYIALALSITIGDWYYQTYKPTFKVTEVGIFILLVGMLIMVGRQADVVTWPFVHDFIDHAQQTIFKGSTASKASILYFYTQAIAVLLGTALAAKYTRNSVFILAFGIASFSLFRVIDELFINPLKLDPYEIALYPYLAFMIGYAIIVTRYREKKKLVWWANGANMLLHVSVAIAILSSIIREM